MIYEGNTVRDLKIAYIGGGSRGWAWTLMTDLEKANDLSGSVYLYDIDFEAAKNNEIIGNKINKDHWSFKAVKTIGEALTGADFVVVSILPATFDEMESDVHAPEKYKVYQSVGDTTGPGGLFRALRTLPMMQEIAAAVREFCPKAWVLNYTNPMAMCVKALYAEFPQIKAYGCCHEVFGTQKLMTRMLKEELDLDVKRQDISINVVGVNHFTWLTKAQYRNIDLFPMYREYATKHYAGIDGAAHDNWANNSFKAAQRVKFDLFLKYGYVAAAGDRHLAEFMNKEDYLDSPEQVREWKFGLTTVAWRKDDLKKRLEKSQRLVSGEEEFDLTKETGEEGVDQMRALLGLCDLVTNVNVPNKGQIPNLPLGAVVESNAAFRADSLTPVLAGEIPASIYPLVSRICTQQENISEAIAERDVEKIFACFANDPLVTCSISDARKLFAEMCENTKKYLTSYDLSSLKG